MNLYKRVPGWAKIIYVCEGQTYSETFGSCDVRFRYISKKIKKRLTRRDSVCILKLVHVNPVGCLTLKQLESFKGKVYYPE